MYNQAKYICVTLQNAGYEAYFVGGCVRDTLLGRSIKDIDIATNALPDIVEELFPKTFAVGKQFGVINVLVDSYDFEVATFRTDGSYSDGRRPDNVRFATIKEDALRRDFTINALYYDPISDKTIDLTNGIKDLHDGIIRFIQNPESRIEEDKLRIMRAIRFASRFNFKIDDMSYQAIKKYANQIHAVSVERIWDEFAKMLLDRQYRVFLTDLYDTGVLKEIFPDMVEMIGCQQPPEFHPEGDVWEHTLQALEALDSNAPLELITATLFHDIGKPVTMQILDRIRFNGHDKTGAELTEKILRYYKCSNKFISAVTELIAFHMKFMAVTKMKKSKLIRFIRVANFNWHMELHRVDCVSSHGKLDKYEFLKEKLTEFKNSAEEVVRPTTLINGNDLINLGFKPGPLFKEILRSLEDEQLEGNISSRIEALDYVTSKYNQ